MSVTYPGIYFHTSAMMPVIFESQQVTMAPVLRSSEELMFEIVNCSSHRSCYSSFEEVDNEAVAAYCNLTALNGFKDRCCDQQIKVDENDATLLNTILNVWLMGLFGMLGVVSNVLAAIVLNHPRMSGTTTSLYLRILSLSDLILCLVVTMFCLADFGDILPENVVMLYVQVIPYVSVIPHISRVNSIMLVVAVTVERYIAVCHPLKAQRLCTMRNCRFLICVIFTVALLSNAPRLLFLEHAVCFGLDTNIMSDFFISPITHIVYNVIFEAIIYCICPFTILMVFNILLLRSVRRSTAFIRRSKSAHERRSEENQRQLTVMLVVLVAAFVTCQVPAVIYGIFVRPLTFHDPSMRNNEIVILIDQIRNFPVLLNSALNFWLYCAAGQKFRQVLFLIFCGRCKASIKGVDANHRSSAHNYTQGRPSIQSTVPSRRVSVNWQRAKRSGGSIPIMADIINGDFATTSSPSPSLSHVPRHPVKTTTNGAALSDDDSISSKRMSKHAERAMRRANYIATGGTNTSEQALLPRNSDPEHGIFFNV